jgi:glycosyltransferase involved in cell wall biosynthesis
MRNIVSSIPSDALMATRLGYLSGAPRVTTRADAELAGPRAHVLGVIAGFEAAGWTVDPFIVGDRAPSVVARDGERLVRRSWSMTLAADAARLVLRARSAGAAWRALGGRVDWVYERFALFQALGAPFARRGTPWILETNALLADEARRERASVVLHRTAARLERAAYHDCDVLVAVSEALADRLVEVMAVPRRKILVVPNGVDVDRFDPARTGPRAPTVWPDAADPGVPVVRIAFAGSLAPWQGLDTLLTAIDRARTTGVAVRLLVAGDGPARASLERLARDLGLADAVRFLGQVRPDEVPSLLASADLCYVGHVELGAGSDAFRSPLKLYEYLAAAKPVLASAVPDAALAIDDGETGYLFAPGDVDALTRALRRAAADRTRWAAMGARARAGAVAHHSWDARVRAMIAGVTGILASAPGAPRAAAGTRS